MFIGAQPASPTGRWHHRRGPAQGAVFTPRPALLGGTGGARAERGHAAPRLPVLAVPALVHLCGRPGGLPGGRGPALPATTPGLATVAGVTVPVGRGARAPRVPAVRGLGAGPALAARGPAGLGGLGAAEGLPEALVDGAVLGAVPCAVLAARALGGSGGREVSQGCFPAAGMLEAPSAAPAQSPAGRHPWDPGWCRAAGGLRPASRARPHPTAAPRVQGALLKTCTLSSLQRPRESSPACGGPPHRRTASSGRAARLAAATLLGYHAASTLGGAACSRGQGRGPPWRGPAVPVGADWPVAISSDLRGPSPGSEKGDQTDCTQQQSPAQADCRPRVPGSGEGHPGATLRPPGLRGQQGRARPPS